MEASQRVAAALVRAWLEADDEAVLKVRVASVSETGELTTLGTATSVEATCEIVRGWLEQLIRRDRPDPSSGDPAVAAARAAISSCP